jgi:hypothetical protein
MNRDNDPPSAQAEAPSQQSRAQEDRRVAARRRFLRQGVGGTAALVVTVTHKRAFAGGIKKGVVASACTSLRGVPDLKGVNAKKALQTSAMGTPKGLICRPKTGDTNKKDICPPSSTHQSHFYTDSMGGRMQVYNVDDLKDGCGDISTTINYANTSRLYDKGFCPIVYDSQGLRYDTTARYFNKSGSSYVSTACSPQQ